MHAFGREAPRDLGEPARFGDCSTRRITRGSSYGPNQLGKGPPPRPVSLAHVTVCLRRFAGTDAHCVVQEPGRMLATKMVEFQLVSQSV